MCWNSIKFFSVPIFCFFSVQLEKHWSRKMGGGVGQGKAVGPPGSRKSQCEVNGDTFHVGGGEGRSWLQVFIRSHSSARGRRAAGRELVKQGLGFSRHQ